MVSVKHHCHTLQLPSELLDHVAQVAEQPGSPFKKGLKSRMVGSGGKCRPSVEEQQCEKTFEVKEE